MDLVGELHRIGHALGAEGVPFAVCGGLAVTIHGAPRTTRDIDLVIGDGELDRVLETLRPIGYRFVAAPMVYDRGTETERTLHRVTRIEGAHAYTLDLMEARGFLEPVLAGRFEVALPAGRLWVVSREGLATMKRVSGRPQDLRDMELLGLDHG